MGSYSQQWVSVRTTPAQAGAKHWDGHKGTQWACYGGMAFDNTTSFTFFQYVSKKCADRHEEVLKWLQQYFKFDFGRSEDAIEQVYRIRGTTGYCNKKEGVGFWVSFSNKDFVTKAHRMFFLTMARGCHEHPSLYMNWDMEKGWEDLWRKIPTWKRDDKYEFVFVSEPTEGHALMDTYGKGHAKVCPSMETILAKFYSGHDGMMQYTTCKIMKGNTK